MPTRASRALFLTLSVAAVTSGCAAPPRPSPGSPPCAALGAAAVPATGDVKARDLALAWLARRGLEVPTGQVRWGELLPSQTLASDAGSGSSSRTQTLRAEIARGYDESNAAVIHTYYFELRDGAVIAAWGPRTVGTGCTCNYPDIMRIP